MRISYAMFIAAATALAGCDSEREGRQEMLDCADFYMAAIDQAYENDGLYVPGTQRRGEHSILRLRAEGIKARIITSSSVTIYDTTTKREHEFLDIYPFKMEYKFYRLDNGEERFLVCGPA